MFYTKRLFILSAVASAVCLSACGDDDEEETISQMPQSIMSDLLGERQLLTSVGNLQFTYADGKLSKISDDENGSITLDGDNFVITEDGGTQYNVRLNSDGFIAQFDASDSYAEAGESLKFSVNVNCSYSNRRLTQLKRVAQSVVMTTAGVENISIEATVNNTWSAAGTLDKIEIVEVEKHDCTIYGKLRDQKGTLTSTYRFTCRFSDGEVENPLCQMPSYIASTATYDTFSPLALVGLYGDGPSLFPDAVELEWSNSVEADGILSGFGGSDSGSEAYNLSYALNENGTIDIEEKFKGEAESDNVTDHSELYYGYDAYVPDGAATSATNTLGSIGRQLRRLGMGRYGIVGK